MGKEPFPGGRASTFETIATDEQIADCRWGYQCSVCLLAGDLLCCEVRSRRRVRLHPLPSLLLPPHTLVCCLGSGPSSAARILPLPLAYCSTPTAAW